jgi:hypothetical protein
MLQGQANEATFVFKGNEKKRPATPYGTGMFMARNAITTFLDHVNTLRRPDPKP